LYRGYDLTVSSNETGVLADRLRHLRLGLGLTQEQFAEKAGITYKYYQAIERGVRKDLKFSTIHKLSHAANLTISQLLDTGLSSEELLSISLADASRKKMSKKRIRQ